MKAVVLEKPGQLVSRELPDPACPPGGVLVQVMAYLVCSTDYHMWKVGHPALRCPRILGHEIAGVVAQVSSEVRGIKAGDKVQLYPGITCGLCRFCRRGRENLCPDIRIHGFTLDGGFAQYIALPEQAIKNGCLNPIHYSLSFAEAALAEPLACCLNGLERSDFRQGESILILGAGPIGSLFALVSRYLGAILVILVEQDPLRTTLCQAAMADAVIDPDKVDVLTAVRELTGGLGVDVVVTCCREAALEYPLLQLAAPNGRILMFSGISEKRGVVPTDLNLVHYRQLAIVGAYGCTSIQCGRALELQAQGLDAGWLISQRVNLSGLEQWFSALSSQTVMKVCVEPWEGDDG